MSDEKRWRKGAEDFLRDTLSAALCIRREEIEVAWEPLLTWLEIAPKLWDLPYQGDLLDDMKKALDREKSFGNVFRDIKRCPRYPKECHLNCDCKYIDGRLP